MLITNEINLTTMSEYESENTQGQRQALAKLSDVEVSECSVATSHDNATDAPAEFSLLSQAVSSQPTTTERCGAGDSESTRPTTTTPHTSPVITPKPMLSPRRASSTAEPKPKSNAPRIPPLELYMRVGTNGASGDVDVDVDVNVAPGEGSRIFFKNFCIPSLSLADDYSSDDEAALASIARRADRAGEGADGGYAQTRSPGPEQAALGAQTETLGFAPISFSKQMQSRRDYWPSGLDDDTAGLDSSE